MQTCSTQIKVVSLPTCMLPREYPFNMYGSTSQSSFASIFASTDGIWLGLDRCTRRLWMCCGLSTHTGWWQLIGQNLGAITFPSCLFFSTRLLWAFEWGWWTFWGRQGTTIRIVSICKELLQDSMLQDEVDVHHVTRRWVLHLLS